MRQDNVLGCPIKTVAQPISDVFVRQMAYPRKYSLLQIPGIDVARCEHIAAVVGFDDDGRAPLQLFGYERRHVAEVHYCCNLHALVCSGEAEIINGIVRYRERMEIDLTNPKVSA